MRLICLLLLCAALPASAADLPHLSAEDVFALEYAAEPRVSADGSTVVYRRRSNDIMTDRTAANLWLLDVRSGAHRPLVSGAEQASSPRWSPDGGRIAWVQDLEEGKALQVRWLGSGETARVAQLPHPPRHLSWSPDGRWLAFVMLVPEERDTLVKAPKKPEGADWAEPVQVIDSPIYRWDGRGFLEPYGDQVFVVPADGGSPRQLTTGEYRHSGPLAWTPDGRELLFSANLDADWAFQPGERDLWSVALADGTLTRLTDRPGGETAPAVSPDGRHVAYRYDHNAKAPYRTRVLTLLDRRDGSSRPLSADLDRRVAGHQWQPDGRGLLLSYDDRGRRVLARVDLDGDLQELTNELGGTTLGRPYIRGDWHLGGDGVVAFTRGTAQRPADIAVARLGRRGLREQRVLTDLNGDLLDHRALGEVQHLPLTSAVDGTPLDAWYVTPPDFDPEQRYPLLLEIHGGPHLAYGPHWSTEIQRYAAEGFVVVYVNHRGSSSYGETFGLLLQHKYASPEDFGDHMTGVDAMLETGFIDPQRLYITGGSAGGIASAYAIGLTDRFRAAAVAKPVINWLSKTLTGDGYINQIHYQFPGPPWEEFAHYWQRSPLSLVGNVTTPTLLITGEQDLRTPIGETEQYYQALKLRGVETLMVRVPGSPHGIAGRPSRLIAKVEHVIAWFRRHGADGVDQEDNRVTD